MAANEANHPRLYLTHAWTREEEGDFGHLARQLRAVGLDAIYDSIGLQTDAPLWSRTLPRIASGNVDGWAYLVTPRSLTDRRCREELLCALDRVYEQKGAGFPLFGLLHGVAAHGLPPGLKLRPSIHLADPNWKEQVLAFMSHNGVSPQTQFLWKVHDAYGGDASQTAIEVSPRGEGIRFWRFAVPASVPAVQWGHGPAGGGEISPFMFSVVRGTGKLENTEITWFGSEDSLSQTESAYLVFRGRLPEFVCFGRAAKPTGPPGKMEIYRTARSRLAAGQALSRSC